MANALCSGFQIVWLVALSPRLILQSYFCHQANNLANGLQMHFAIDRFAFMFFGTLSRSAGRVQKSPRLLLAQREGINKL
jgi:hypothetical protein